MVIITCAGFYRTGSSAISDFFTEFDNCKSLGDTEFRFLQDPDGVSDLEYNLIENPHRHNSSHAIKRFLRLSAFNNGRFLSRRYSRVFGNAYSRCTNDYIGKIVNLTCKAWWHVDQIDKGTFAFSVDRIISKISGCFSKYRDNLSLSCRREKAYFTSISENEFLKYTVEYTESLFKSVSEGFDFVLADQLVPPTNIDRYLRYFKKLKVIVVDRDPRDLFYIENRFYRWGIIPYKNVETFCEWYRITRQQAEKTKSHNALYIRFEDLVFDYEETTQKIMEYVGIDPKNHVKPFAFFDPKQSQKYIGVYKSDKRFQKQIAYIEQHLKEYCYDVAK